MNSASTAPQGLTEERSSKEKHVKEIALLLSKGLTLKLAANAAGYTEAEVRTWMEADPAVEIELGAAEAEFQMVCLDAILRARDKQGNANVRALMWLLESRYPEQYGRGRRKQPGSKKRLAGDGEEAPPVCDVPCPPVPEEPLAPASLEHSSEYLVESFGQTCGHRDHHSKDTQAAFLSALAKPTPIRVLPKPGRNTPCPCGSGRKYKHCCGSVSRQHAHGIAA